MDRGVGAAEKPAKMPCVSADSSAFVPREQLPQQAAQVAFYGQTYGAWAPVKLCSVPSTQLETGLAASFDTIWKPGQHRALTGDSNTLYMSRVRIERKMFGPEMHTGVIYKFPPFRRILRLHQSGCRGSKDMFYWRNWSRSSATRLIPTSETLPKLGKSCWSQYLAAFKTPKAVGRSSRRFSSRLCSLRRALLSWMRRVASSSLRHLLLVKALPL